MNTRIPMVHVRSFTLQTLSGHSITFEGPTKPVMVAPEAVKEALASGAATADGSLLDRSGVTKDRLERVADEPVGEEREGLIKMAMSDMVAINNADDFDANGAPKLRALNALLPFKATSDERSALWAEVKASME